MPMVKLAVWMLMVVLTAARYDWVLAGIVGCAVMLCAPSAPAPVKINVRQDREDPDETE